MQNRQPSRAPPQTSGDTPENREAMRLAFAAFCLDGELISAVDALFHQGWDQHSLTLLASLAARRGSRPWIRRLGKPRDLRGQAAGGRWRFSDSHMLKELQSRDVASTDASERLLRDIMPAASAAYFAPLVDDGAWLLFAETNDVSREKVACRILLAHAASNVHLCDLGGAAPS